MDVEGRMVEAARALPRLGAVMEERLIMVVVNGLEVGETRWNREVDVPKLKRVQSMELWGKKQVVKRRQVFEGEDKKKVCIGIELKLFLFVVGWSYFSILEDLWNTRIDSIDFSLDW
jgi:hypothetical protein